MKIMRWLYPNLTGQIPTILIVICFATLAIGIINLVVGVTGDIIGALNHSAATTFLRFNLLLLATAFTSAIMLHELNHQLESDQD
jgi:cobalamin synthase